MFNVALLNPGGHYDVTTGIYTVPIDGVYEFTYHVWDKDDPIFDVFLIVDNVRVRKQKRFQIQLATCLC